MAGHPDADDNEIDVWVLHHRVNVVKGEGRIEFLLRSLGGILVGRTDRLERVVGQQVEGRYVGVGTPATSALGHGCADDADANRVSHGCFSPVELAVGTDRAVVDRAYHK
jgi:hypothetical protein